MRPKFGSERLLSQWVSSDSELFFAVFLNIEPFAEKQRLSGSSPSLCFYCLPSNARLKIRKKHNDRFDKTVCVNRVDFLTCNSVEFYNARQN